MTACRAACDWGSAFVDAMMLAQKVRTGEFRRVSGVYAV